MSKKDKGLAPSKAEEAKKDAKVNTANLPETVPGTSDMTIKPRPGHPSDIDLTPIMDNPEMVEMYRLVSDQIDHHLQNTEIGKNAMECLAKYSDIAIASDAEEVTIEDPEAVLAEVGRLSVDYSKALNRSDNVFQGTVCGTRLIQASFFNIEKKIIDDHTDRSFVKYFIGKFGRSRLRSEQDYMRMAKVPMILGWSYLGKERLLHVVQLMEEWKDENGRYVDSDPVARFMAESGIDFSSNDQADHDMIKRETDVSLAMKLIEKQNLTSFVTREAITRLVDSGIKNRGKLVRELTFARDIDPNSSQSNIDMYVEKFEADGKVDKVETSQRKVDELLASSKALKSKVAKVVEEEAALSKVSVDLIEIIRSQLNELESKYLALTSTN